MADSSIQTLQLWGCNILRFRSDFREACGFYPHDSTLSALAETRALADSCIAVIFFGGTSMLFTIVRRGRKTGICLHPHLFADERYHVSLTKEGPFIPLADDRDIPEYLANGYSLSMSNPAQSLNPRLVKPASIKGWI
jgi:hypothetical protein